MLLIILIIFGLSLFVLIEIGLKNKQFHQIDLMGLQPVNSEWNQILVRNLTVCQTFLVALNELTSSWMPIAAKNMLKTLHNMLSLSVLAKLDPIKPPTIPPIAR